MYYIFLIYCYIRMGIYLDSNRYKTQQHWVRHSEDLFLITPEEELIMMKSSVIVHHCLWHR
jgi:hypothetical protein